MEKLFLTLLFASGKSLNKSITKSHFHIRIYSRVFCIEMMFWSSYIGSWNQCNCIKNALNCEENAYVNDKSQQLSLYRYISPLTVATIQLKLLSSHYNVATTHLCQHLLPVYVVVDLRVVRTLFEVQKLKLWNFKSSSLENSFRLLFYLLSYFMTNKQTNIHFYFSKNILIFLFWPKRMLLFSSLHLSLSLSLVIIISSSMWVSQNF